MSSWCPFRFWNWFGWFGWIGSGGRGQRRAGQLVDDLVEGVAPGRPGRARQPGRRGKRSAGVGGAVARGQPKLDRLARRVEPDEVHSRRRARPDDRDLEVVRRPRLGRRRLRVPRRRGSRLRGPEEPRQLPRRPGWPIPFRPPMPLDDERIEAVDGPVKRGGPLDDPEEKGRPDAQIRRDYGTGAGVAKCEVDGGAVVVPAGPCRDEAAAAR